MKICLISFAYIESGTIPGLRALAGQPGIELTLITPPEYRVGLQTANGRFDHEDTGCRVIKVPIHFGSRQGAFLYHQRALERALDACQPDLIYHEQEVFALSAGQVSYIAFRRDLPVVQFVSELLNRKLVLPRQWIRKYVLRHAAGLIGVSIRSVEIHRFWGLRSPAAVFAQFGTPWNPDALLGRRGAQGKLKLCYAGRLAQQKGVDVMLRAIAKVRRSGLAVSCIILGRGPELNILIKLAQELGIADDVEFAPPRPAEGVFALLRESDVHILCSRRDVIWEEQFGRILIEGMAQACICVGSSTGAIPEVLGSEEITFTEDDDQMLAGLLVRLAEDDEFFLRHQSRQWRRVEEVYTPEAVAVRKIAFLRECLALYQQHHGGAE